jgi:hypothetical protein
MMKVKKALSDWSFHPSFDPKTLDGLCAILFEPATSLVQENYRKARRMLKGTPASQICAASMSGAFTGLLHDGEQVWLLCHVTVARSKHKPDQVLIFVGPHETIVERANDIKAQIDERLQAPGAEAVMIERK